MSAHETTYCQRCKAAFECKPENITQCQCYGIAFTEEEKEQIGKAYTGCLCRACLIELKRIRK